MDHVNRIRMRVARAIHDQRAISAPPCPDWEHASDDSRRVALEIADAAIVAVEAAFGEAFANGYRPEQTH